VYATIIAEHIASVFTVNTATRLKGISPEELKMKSGDTSLLGCDKFLTFNGSCCIHLQGKAVKEDSMIIKMKALQSFVTSGITHPTTCRHFAELRSSATQL
jgi:hypothetical protein